MRITRVIWLRDIVDKLEWKHQVAPDEVEEILAHWELPWRTYVLRQIRGRWTPGSPYVAAD